MSCSDRISRSTFLRLLGLGASAPVFNPVSWAWDGPPVDYSSAAAELIGRSLVIDGVIALSMERGTKDPAWNPGEIKKLTGIDIGIHTVRLSSMERLNRSCEQHGDALVRISRSRDIDPAAQGRRFGLIYYVQQGFDLKGSVSPLEEWKMQGLRSLQLTYTSNELGGGSESDEQPLTALGRSVVREMNRLGMVVDVSHSGRRTTLDAAEATVMPITANHANVLRLTSHRRNKTDEELKAIAATGGVVAITGINRFLLRNRFAPATVEDFVRHTEYLVDLIGIDHVGISSDSHVDGSQRYDVDYSDPLLCSTKRWFYVARRLMERGYKEEDLQKILGLNFRRVFRKVLDP